MANSFDSPEDGVRTSIRVEPFSMDLSTGLCPSERPAEPCTFVIIGATGDLCKRKLAPALYRLYVNNSLPASFLIVGCGRTPLDDSRFREQMKEAVIAAAALDSSQWESFVCTSSLSNPPV